jgi:hypothetical protein
MNSTEVTYSDIKNAQKAYEDQKIALTMFQNMKHRFYAGRGYAVTWAVTVDKKPGLQVSR